MFWTLEELLYSVLRSSLRIFEQRRDCSQSIWFTAYILLFSFKEEADAKCCECCQKAIEYDATNPEAFQLMASCLLSQQNMEEARKMLEKSLELWQGKEEELPEVSAE